ncbi:hypothetical protein BDZ94DRAFT_734244 [Collybia nuda]|uniref:Uncharacterized protein n=1 Tax=Collybia nuda TaxID=64659 RepID=A0A9P6CDZ0_9AGAR|nr:hypothetical protein BDZ94DRAFT_734244 [Collybia nuda]
MILLSGRSRRSLLAFIVILAQICLGLGVSLKLRQDGDSDSDSDDDETSESCRNGVCTTITKGRGGQGSATQTGASASTQGANNPSNTPSSNSGTQGSNTNGHGNNHTGTGNGVSATNSVSHSSANPSASGGSAATDHGDSGNKNDLARKGGLSTGGIVGLVIGLAILAGLIIMFLLKRRNHLRHVRKRPRGSMFLSSGPASLQLSGSPNGEMSQVPFSPSVLSPGAVAAAHVRTVEGQQAGNYGPPNVRADGTSSSYTPLLPIAQYSDSAPTRQATLHSSNHTNTADSSSLMEPLPSPHETSPPTSWGDAAFIAAGMAPSASSSSSAQKALPNTPSVIHSEMAAYQKALERDDEKSNQPSSSRVDVTDPPPLYTD